MMFSIADCVVAVTLVGVLTSNSRSNDLSKSTNRIVEWEERTLSINRPRPADNDSDNNGRDEISNLTVAVSCLSTAEPHR
ncbi:hypothetical protein J6590_030682 [Homalodisca vitripennis]|nr:hypothetical protein J6590_030682 [Homalodisca vitripennis]